MICKIENIKDIKDLTNVELRKIIQAIDLTNTDNKEKVLKILQEYNIKKQKLILYFENKLIEEIKVTNLLLKKLWNGINIKTPEMAKVFKEIEDSINK